MGRRAARHGDVHLAADAAAADLIAKTSVKASAQATYDAAVGTEEIKTAKEKLKTAKRYFVSGLRDMNPEKQYYPDANSTLRLTYGNVLPYDPKDGVTYHYTTTLDGIMQKEDPTNPEFIVDPRIKETWKKKDYGQYADKDGRLVVNFLSNNDITGGNSGSPVIKVNVPLAI